MKYTESTPLEVLADQREDLRRNQEDEAKRQAIASLAHLDAGAVFDHLQSLSPALRSKPKQQTLQC